MFSILDTVPALDAQTDRRTDRQNWYNNIALCMHYMLTCDKNARYMTTVQT